ncbi:hypothetical protein ABMA28_001569 [Loxostege sticticalis]|uniref:TFIIS N-terminal domain-containing protein n=1 Tax=Loxostege sticticalis TaxID=481309 RepID=A0ABD0T248_LOXSC
MATVLDLVKHYQHAIEKYPNDEHKVLKCIDKLFNLDVTVQHLQETGVGRTVNALRKEPGDVGHAARALVYKWKLMVAAEESDQDGDHNNDTSGYNGHENGKDSDDNVKQVSKNRNDHHEKSSPVIKTEPKEVNGNYSGSKRKYHSSEEEEPDTKKSKSSGYNSHDDYKKKPVEQIKKEPSESEDESEDSDHSQSDSDSEMSESSEEEKHTKHETKQEPTDRHRSSSSSKHSSHKSSTDTKRESSSSKSHDAEKHSKKHHQTDATDKHSSDKSKEKSHSSHKHKSSKEKDKSEKSSKSEKHSSEKDKKQKDDSKSSSSSTKHSSDADKHKSSKTDNNVEKQHHTEKHSSKSEKHRSSSSSHSQKSDKEKHKSSSEKEISDEKHKSKHSSSSKEKHSSSSKERSKDRSSSSKEKTDSSAKDHHSHKSEKKHSSSSESKSKHSDSKHKADKRDERSSETKSKHKSSSSSSHKSKSSSSKSKEEVPKKTNQANSSVDSDDGIDCGSGASFAEALGMVSPAKPKKKPGQLVKESPVNNDLSPASLLAPTAKLAPLPAIEISALPEISPNYKPRPPPKLLPHFTDEDAMSMNMSSKNQRTKVYSGNKVIGKIPTLYEMCVQVLQEHIDALEYTGGVPYDILKPVVDRATPQQLFLLEHYNPYLMEDTDHLWQKFCEKNFRNKQRQEMETWREMYMRCQEEQEHRLKSLTANIRIAQEAKKAPIKQTKMAYVDSVVKPPRNIARKQALHGTAHAASASPAARVASLAAAPNVLRGNTRPTPTAAGVSSFKPKKAPLMQKALQFMRGRKR